MPKAAPAKSTTTYSGSRPAAAPKAGTVTVSDASGSRPLRPTGEHFHSFDWGSRESRLEYRGRRELAVSILAAHYGLTVGRPGLPGQVKDPATGKVLGRENWGLVNREVPVNDTSAPVWENFEKAFVDRFEDSWTLTSEQIDAWVEAGAKAPVPTVV